MVRPSTSTLKNTYLVSSGRQSHDWASMHMPTLVHALNSFGSSKPLKNLRIGFCLQMTAETSVLILASQRLGAKITACAGNPHTTQNDIAAYLTSCSIRVHAWNNQTRAEFQECILRVMDDSPDILVDDGAELSTLAHTKYTNVPILGATEETTTGINRIRALSNKISLRYPIIAVNNALTKVLFDNAHGTGQSTISALLRSCGVFIASKIVVVAGYGAVGRGVASKCKGLGARVIIAEINPIRALEAHMDGYNVKKMSIAAKIGQIFITCTGQRDVITASHMKVMPDGAILVNVGHFNVEIDTKALVKMSHHKRRVRANLDEFTLPTGKHLLLSSDGYVANLVSSTGHSPEIMALSFANQLYSLVHLARNAHTMESRLYDVPQQIDKRIALDSLDASGVRIDVPKTHTLF